VTQVFGKGVIGMAVALAGLAVNAFSIIVRVLSSHVLYSVVGPSLSFQTAHYVKELVHCAS
jgi:hypothetical protein